MSLNCTLAKRGKKLQIHGIFLGIMGLTNCILMKWGKRLVETGLFFLCMLLLGIEE
jgi:hypothetical protein